MLNAALMTNTTTPITAATGLTNRPEIRRMLEEWSSRAGLASAPRFTLRHLKGVFAGRACTQIHLSLHLAGRRIEIFQPSRDAGSALDHALRRLASRVGGSPGLAAA